MQTTTFLKRAGACPKNFALALGGPDVARVEITPSTACARAGDPQSIQVLAVGSLAQQTAERLLHDYSQNPEEFIPAREIEGSFAILDLPRRRCIIGRDRSAAYHLYMGQLEGQLLLSTTLTPFLGTLVKRLSPQGCDLYLRSGICIAPFPLYEGIQAIYPGRFFRINLDNPTHPISPPNGEIFWDVQPTKPPANYDAAVERYAELFLENIRQHIKGDAAGVFLSGGSDSASVVAALHHLGVKKIVAIHMHTPGHQEVELGLVQALQKHYGFQLEIISPPTPEEMSDADRFAFLKESILLDPSGSYPSFPNYRRAAKKLAKHLPPGSVIFNGELCLLDQGFSDASDRWRTLRRWLYRGPGRKLASSPPILPPQARRWSKKIAALGTPRAAMLESIIEILHAIGRPAYFFAGMKLGPKGFPGAARSYLRFSLTQDRDTTTAAVEDFFADFTPGMLSPNWRQIIATMASIWYSEASNFTMALHALSSHPLSICFPFSHPDLMDLAASLPEEWAIDKRVQKDMCSRLFNMPKEVSHFQKDHSTALGFSRKLFSKTLQNYILNSIKSHRLPPVHEGVSQRLKQLQDKERSFSIVEFSMFCLGLYQDALSDH